MKSMWKKPMLIAIYFDEEKREFFYRVNEKTLDIILNDAKNKAFFKKKEKSFAPGVDDITYQVELEATLSDAYDRFVDLVEFLLKKK